jgi:histidinol-phosphate/aromatic aminotransferase/cobyric acid decarboxylase-like protein/choline kinase
MAPLRMQAVILAAGLGRRLGPLTQRSTKFMVPVNGRPLGAYTLEALAAAGISRLVLVVGHGADEVRAYVGTTYRGIPVTYIHNEVYRSTNNISSLLLARDELGADDSLVLESDVLVEPSIIADCVNTGVPNLAVVARYESWMHGTVALLEADGRITRLVPKDDFRPADRARYFKTVNIYRFARHFSRERLVPQLSRSIVERGSGAFYEEVLQVLIGSGEALVALDVGQRRWYEIDDAQDLDIAETVFAPDDERPGRLARRFGGYWRFSHLLDFAYLVNPFFPPAGLLDELGGDLQQLACAYPSGQEVQRFLMGRLVGCQPQFLLVGNGAAELIRALLGECHGPVLIVRPTFEEYPRLVEPRRLLELPARGPNLEYSAADLLAAAHTARPATLVLVNPDNPSGHLLPPSELSPLAAALERLDVRLVVDESFVDFADGSLEHTLLRDDLLLRHPNLVVIRSLGKSYGVPGLRLGVLGCGDAELMRRIEAHVPIWNVNAIAEAFLQRAPAYRTDYASACRQVVAERERLLLELARLPWLRPLPSAANFVLCQLADGVSAQDLARHLLKEAGILIKDCSAKPGLGTGQWVRLAVRKADDNARLLQALDAFAARSVPSAAVSS